MGTIEELLASLKIGPRSGGGSRDTGLPSGPSVHPSLTDHASLERIQRHTGAPGPGGGDIFLSQRPPRPRDPNSPSGGY